MIADENYLRRAIRLAMNGRGRVEPNPMVGCVIVKNDRIIGEGFHQQFGQPHAEPNALASCSELPEGATAYVTLEPCCHTDKKTPPCVPRLIKAQVSRVVAGCLDPNPSVNANGIRQLREAGIIVDEPMLEAECKQLIAPFIKRTIQLQPYLTLKWAQSADGKIAGPSGERVQISNPAASRQMQLLRSRCDGIMVGINTVINDDPVLLPRDVLMRAGYRRMVLDRNLRFPLESMLVKTLGSAPVIVYCELQQSEHLRSVLRAGVKILPTDDWCFDCTFTHILVEPGPTLAKSMLPKADRLWIVSSPNAIDDNTAPSSAHIPDYFVETRRMSLHGDVLTEYLNTQGKAFFAPVTSADFVLAQSETAGSERGDPSL